MHIVYGFRIEAKHFVAGIEVNEKKLCRQNRTNLNYMNGWTLEKVLSYCKYKKWIIELCYD
jgi:low affinity Fe/Cu permease